MKSLINIRVISIVSVTLILLLLVNKTYFNTLTNKVVPYTFIPHNGTIVPPETWPSLEKEFEGKR